MSDEHLDAVLEPTPSVESHPSPPPMISARAGGLWLVLAGVLVALDGPVGGAVAVVAAAILLARLPARLVGGLGVLALGLAPIAVIVQGLPSSSQVSPRFVLRSLLPHHLTFAGLVLVSIWVIIDVLPHLRSAAPAGDRRDDTSRGDASLVAPVVAVAIVVIVAIGAVLASLAVLQA